MNNTRKVPGRPGKGVGSKGGKPRKNAENADGLHSEKL